jgi:aspartate/methionine/tyrosine aminotransferase
VTCQGVGVLVVGVLVLSVAGKRAMQMCGWRVGWAKHVVREAAWKKRAAKCVVVWEKRGMGGR